MGNETNPEYAELEDLLNDVNREMPIPRESLDDLAERLGTGEVWTGQQASNFSTDFDGEKQKLKNRSNDLPDDISERMANVPAELPDDDDD